MRIGVYFCMVFGLLASVDAQAQIKTLDCTRPEFNGFTTLTLGERGFNYLRFDELNNRIWIYYVGKFNTDKSGAREFKTGNYKGGGDWGLFESIEYWGLFGAKDDYYNLISVDVRLGKLRIDASVSRKRKSNQTMESWDLSIDRVSGKITIISNGASLLADSRTQSGTCELTTVDPAVIAPPAPPRTRF